LAPDQTNPPIIDKRLAEDITETAKLLRDRAMGGTRWKCTSSCYVGTQYYSTNLSRRQADFSVNSTLKIERRDREHREHPTFYLAIAN
jgi:hypothetical protein